MSFLARVPPAKAGGGIASILLPEGFLPIPLYYTPMRRSYRFRLYPTTNQARDLTVMLDSHRHLYNQCLETRSLAWKDYRLGINSIPLSSWFKTERNHNHWFAALNFSSAQATMRRLDKAFIAFFDRCKKRARRKGYPRFKGQDRFNSIEYPLHGDGIKLKDKTPKLYIQNIGLIRIKQHRKIQGTIKTVRVLREADQWYAVFSCDLGDVVVPKNTKPAVGIDMGLKSFLTTSDGEHVANPRFFKEAMPELRRAGRSLARKSKGSKHRHEAKRRLQRIHVRVRNQRGDFTHKLSKTIADRYGLVAVESLKIRNMLQNHRLARSISDAAWRQWLEQTRYKCEQTGAEFVEVDPRNTSQLCSQCVQMVPKGLEERWHKCPHCGLVLDRDENAARNILLRARCSPHLVRAAARLARTEPANANEVLQFECNHVQAATPSFEKPPA